MQYAHLYSGKDGQSRFVDLALGEADYRPPAPLTFVSHAFKASGLQFVRLPGGWTGEAINPPERQFLICLEGHIEVTVGSGEKRTFGPGDRILMEDVTGKGHRSHVRGPHECVAAIIPVE